MPREIKMGELDQNNQQFQEILAELENGDKHLLILGKAGTGKSSLLRHFMQAHQRDAAVVAPTGIAAINAGGETIHSFFKLRPGSSLQDAAEMARRLRSRRQLFRSLRVLIIDEISMVRADLLDQVDFFLRAARGRSKTPFGGVRLVMFGDLHQLPPVVKNDEADEVALNYKTPYFFSSHVFKSLISALWPQIAYYELDQIYRQEEHEFIELLQAIRTNQLTDEQLEKLNSRVIFDENELYEQNKAIILTTTNSLAEKINTAKLAELHAQAQHFAGTLSGDFIRQKDNLPTSQKLEFKTGARVMFLNNDSDKRWVNGHLGTVTDFVFDKKTSQASVLVKLDHNDQEVTVSPYTWEMSKTKIVASGELDREVVGTYRQLPLKLAWAVTIHKSQGKTFDELIINLGYGAFATGQTYVALSRCTHLAGIKLTRPLTRDDIKVDPIVEIFLGEMQKRCSPGDEVVL